MCCYKLLSITRVIEKRVGKIIENCIAIVVNHVISFKVVGLLFYEQAKQLVASFRFGF